MTNISSSLPVYTPPAAPVAITPPDVTVDPTANEPVTASTNAPATNADVNAPAVYTALANAATSTIRGANINIAT